MKKIRYPSHAGTFYPANPNILIELLMGFYSEIDNYIDFNKYKELPDSRYIFVPHAGYIYSGIIATAGYKVFQINNLEQIDTLIIIGPAHYDAIKGWMFSDFDAFATPIGLIEVNKELQNYILENNKEYFSIYNHAHIPEHSLEVQIPLIQTFLKVKKIVPILAGLDVNIENVSDFFVKLLRENKNIGLIISTDLSHYLSYDEAVKIDSITLSKIVSGDVSIGPYEACGYAGLNLLIEISKKLNYKRDIILYANSGDTSGMKDKVVGYSSGVVYKK